MARVGSRAAKPARLALTAAALLGALALAWSGAAEPLDQALRDARFHATDRAPSGDTVLVEIDSRSMAAIGVWPWPRRVHAEVLDRLMRLGAAEVVFDVDFSAASDPDDDAAFEKALERAGGYALLAAFQQVTRDGTLVLNAPLSRFAAHSEPVLVNVDGDGTALLRSVPSALPEYRLRSVAVALVPHAAVPSASITIDYGIDLAAIDRISVSELLAGNADPLRFKGKQVVVGSSALELRDFFRVPRFGVIPGPLVQLAATETLKAGRALTDVGFIPAGLAAAIVAALVGLGRWRLSLTSQTGLALVGMIAMEAGAWLALRMGGFSIDTAAFHICMALLLLGGLLHERTLHWREIQRQQQRLAFLATHDPVTGALSRQALLDQLEADLGSGSGSVVLVQLDRLDAAIAALGQEIGDGVASEVARRLEALLGSKPARIANDIFGWSYPDKLDPEQLMGVCTLASSCLNEPYSLHGHSVIIDTRLGASANGAETTASELLRQAEVALIKARADGLAAVIYAPEQSEVIQKRRLQDVALRSALERKEFFLLYQPQVDLATGELFGVEALVRWQNEELGLVSPGDFIPLAEQTGLIVGLGAWVLEEACREAAGWNWSGRLSVNISSVQFRLADVVATVRETLATSGFPANRLDLEITESLFVEDDPAILSALAALRAMGVGIALDDFGTGYSSLSYLSRLPIDKLKIDQSFVRPLPDQHNETIVETIVLMAKRLGKTIVAEGIETAQQRDYLTALGCEVGQGYLLGRPSRPEAIGLSIKQTAVA